MRCQFLGLAYRHRSKQGKAARNVPNIHHTGIYHSLLVIVRPLQDRSAPLAHQPLGHALDLRLRALRLGVEEHDPTNTARHKDFLLDRYTRQRREDVALDVVRWQAGVVAQGFEEKLHGLQEVGFRIKHRVLDILSV